MNIRRKILLCILAGFAGSTAAADWPARAVKIVSPYAAGGSGDVVTRLLASKFAARWKQPVVVENKPGAGSTLGTALVAQAPGDGYTLLLTGGTLTVSAATYAKLPYDPVKDLMPITTVASGSFLLSARPTLGVNTLSELIALARSQPGKLNYGSSGKGTMANLAGEFLKQKTGIEVAHVPFRGSSPAVNALLAGQIDYLLEVPASSLPHVASGKIKPIAVTSPKRMAMLPNVPAVAESIPGFDVQIWWGLFAPKGTPDAVIKEVREATIAALADEEVIKTLTAQGIVLHSSTPGELALMIKNELPMWAEVVRRANLQAD